MSKISVIVPVYNIEKYICDCLSSVEAQNYENLELIVVDDGSTDDTLKKVLEFSNTTKLDMKISKQSNSGVSSARNNGISLSSGQYICFVDGDDIIDPNYLNTLYTNLVQNEVDVSLCSFKPVSDSTTFNRLSFSDQQKSCVIEKHSNLYVLEQFLYTNIDLTVCSLLVSTDYVKRNNLLFTVGAKYSEDMEFLWKVLSNCENVIYTDAELYLYRTRVGSAMSFINDSRKDGLLLYEKLEVYFENTNPEFFPLFKEYGVAKWVWSTIWQISVASKTYSEFQNRISEYEVKKHFRKLKSIKNIKIALSSHLYLFSPLVYYYVTSILGRRKMNHREILE